MLSNWCLSKNDTTYTTFKEKDLMKARSSEIDKTKNSLLTLSLLSSANTKSSRAVFRIHIKFFLLKITFFPTLWKISSSVETVFLGKHKEFFFKRKIASFKLAQKRFYSFKKKKNFLWGEGVSIRNSFFRFENILLVEICLGLKKCFWGVSIRNFFFV